MKTGELLRIDRANTWLVSKNVYILFFILAQLEMFSFYSLFLERSVNSMAIMQSPKKHDYPS